jgi:hypothetical protein
MYVHILFGFLFLFFLIESVKIKKPPHSRLCKQTSILYLPIIEPTQHNFFLTLYSLSPVSTTTTFFLKKTKHKTNTIVLYNDFGKK